MKKIILCGFWGLASLVAWADAPNDIDSLLQAAGANPAKVLGVTFNFPAYVRGVEVATIKGNKTAVVEFGNGPIRLACLMPVNVAGKLKGGQQIQIKGKVEDVKSNQYFDPTWQRTVNGKVVVANCSMGPAAVIKPTPEPVSSVKQDARGFEVSGLKLGMTVAQVQKALKMTKSPNSGSMWWEDHDEQKGVITCKYDMKFTNDNPDGVLYRLTTDRSGTFATMDVVKEAAIKKYGAPDDMTYQPFVDPFSVKYKGERETLVIFYGMTRKGPVSDRAGMRMEVTRNGSMTPNQLYLDIRIELEDTPLRNKVWQDSKDKEAREAQQRADEQKKRDANIKF